MGPISGLLDKIFNSSYSLTKQPLFKYCRVTVSAFAGIAASLGLIYFTVSYLKGRTKWFNKESPKPQQIDKPTAAPLTRKAVILGHRKEAESWMLSNGQSLEQFLKTRFHLDLSYQNTFAGIPLETVPIVLERINARHGGLGESAQILKNPIILVGSTINAAKISKKMFVARSQINPERVIMFKITDGYKGMEFIGMKIDINPDLLEEKIRTLLNTF